MKKLSSIALITMLTLSIAAVFTVSPVLAAEPYIAFNPENTVFMAPVNGSTFSVYVNISALTDGFCAYQFYLYWNRTYITMIGNASTPPSGFSFGSYTFAPNYNASYGHLMHYFMDPTLTEKTGTFTVARIDFQIIQVPKAPIDPDALIELDFDEVNTLLSRDDGTQVTPFNVYDGTVFLKSLMAAPPTVYVDPPEYYSSGIGEIFTIDIKIKDVVKAHHMWGWEFVMWYNTTLLDTLNVTEGTFLSNINKTFFIGKFGSMYDPAYVNTTYEDNWWWNGTAWVVNRPVYKGEGKIHAACLLAPDDPAYYKPPEGTGTLATIKFNATYETIAGAEPPAWCWLDIGIVHGDTEVADTPEFWPPKGEVPHISESGKYYAYVRSLGRDIDCWTDPYRKYMAPWYYTTFTGMDPQVNADAYQPQDLVILYALVTYGEDPVQNKLVQFDIEPFYHDGTPIELKGFPLHRVALTDAYGIAEIEFRIPWPCVGYNPPLPWYFKCYQSVDIACKKVEDILWFEVVWYIWLKGCEVTPDPHVHKCEDATVTFSYENHALMPLHVYFTVVLYDHQMVPIGMDVVDTMIPAGNDLCDPYVGEDSVSIHIPKWAFKGAPGGEWGPYPAAFVNAYTFRCSLCGMPYCPEVSDTFTIG